MFYPINSKRIPKKSSLFDEIFKIIHQCVPFLSLRSDFEIKNGYFLPGIILSNIMNLLVLSEQKTPRKCSFKSSLFIYLNTRSVSKLEIPFVIFTDQIFHLNNIHLYLQRNHQYQGLKLPLFFYLLFFL